MIGYLGLTVSIIYSLKRNIPVLLWRIVASIIFIHVFMVWNFHYEWNFSMAVRNGFSGFLIFHSALLMIIISTVVKKAIAIILIRIASVVVTVGAIGAVFRYDIVSIYKIPVLICAGLIILSFVKIFIGMKNLNKDSGKNI